ncbi:uncharacterized protein DAT39_006479, partial [Clarias magur]
CGSVLRGRSYLAELIKRVQLREYVRAHRGARFIQTATRDLKTDKSHQPVSLFLHST